MTKTKLYFSKDPDQRLDQTKSLDLPDWSKQNRPEQYVIDDDHLVAAINAALILGQPLLLTGEPGTGKTTLAARVAWQLGLQKPLPFETKSTSVARDLFYTYDTVGRFQAAQPGSNGSEAAGNLPYLTFQALGKAIILTGATDQKLRRRVQESDGESPPADKDSPLPPPQRSVVLIDEIDKAHRDLPSCPECNVLFDREVDPQSKTPAFKNELVTVTAEAWRLWDDRSIKPTAW